MLTWSVVALLAFGVYGQRALGMALIDPKRMSGQARSVLAMIPLSILCAVTALQTLSTEGELVADARIGGIGLAALLEACTDVCCSDWRCGRDCCVAGALVATFNAVV